MAPTYTLRQSLMLRRNEAVFTERCPTLGIEDRFVKSVEETQMRLEQENPYGTSSSSRWSKQIERSLVWSRSPGRSK